VLTDIISVKRERYTGYYPTGQSMIRPDMTRRVTGKRTIRYNILKDLKLSLKECRIAASIKNDLPQNQQFYHASLGLRASEFELYDVMIIEFYKVIEVDRNILSNECKKYEPLRDVLSHPDEIRPETRERLKTEFGDSYFDLTRRGEFDYHSSKNKQHLRIEADKLRKIAMNNLTKKL
jgi:hypothetical protein